jgi:hypothetical protein
MSRRATTTKTPEPDMAQTPPPELPSRWMTHAEVLARFGWTPTELRDASTLGFPTPSAFRQLRQPGVNGMPNVTGTASLWSRSGVEQWASVFADLARKTVNRL